MKTTVKRGTLAVLLLAAAVLLSACGSKPAPAAADQVPVVISNAEYLLYQNIFYNDYGARYEGTEVTKQGVFAAVQDGYSNVTRYYVWGYLDNTKCCDWQWEIKVKDAKDLPVSGSLVNVKGTFAASGDALDGYWITDPAIETVTAYTGPLAEVDMSTMSDTLERVQVINIMNRKEMFEGKTFSAYGRIASMNVLQDPYYDGSWQIPFMTNAQQPAIGTTVELRGVIKNGMLTDCTVQAIQ